MLTFDLKDFTHSLGSFTDPEYSIFPWQITVPALSPKEEKQYVHSTVRILVLAQYYCKYEKLK